MKTRPTSTHRLIRSLVSYYCLSDLKSLTVEHLASHYKHRSKLRSCRKKQINGKRLEKRQESEAISSKDLNNHSSCSLHYLPLLTLLLLLLLLLLISPKHQSKSDHLHQVPNPTLRLLQMPPIQTRDRQRRRESQIPFPLLPRRSREPPGEAAQEHREAAQGEALSET